MKRVALLAILILTVAVLSGTGTYLWLRSAGGRAGTELQASSGPTTTHLAAPGAATYHCPMHPGYVKDGPGDCPICGMRLVLTRESPGESAEGVEGEPGGDDAVTSAASASRVEGYATVNIPARKRQHIGVQTALVERRLLVPEIHAVGRVDYDETRLVNVNTKVGGWIEKLHVDRTGQLVRRGQPLLDLYSPELIATQEEYLLAVDSLGRLEASGALPTALSQARDLVADARRRLSLWDIPDMALDALETRQSLARTLPLRSPAGGYVVEKRALLGQAITAGESLFRIADLDRVWILAEVYELQAAAIRQGQKAQVQISYMPGRVFPATVDYVYPYLDPKTRTLRVRLVVPNTDLSLRPEMYASILFRAPAAGPTLVVPNAAILDTGERRVAFVSRGEGIFEPRELVTGMRTREHTEVREGLAEGEEVVISGNFLIDSESRLKAALAAMGAGAGPTGHRHGE